MTIACLKGFGKMPFLRDKVTSDKTEGRRMSIHCFTICVGHGSREQVFDFIYLFIWGFYIAFNTVQVIS